MRWFAKAVLRFRGILALALVLVTVGAALQARSVGFDFSPTALFLTDDPELQYLREFRNEFGSEDAYIFILAVAPDEIFTPGRLHAIGRLSDEAAELPGIDRVLSLGNVSMIRGQPGSQRIEALYEEVPESPSDLSAVRDEVLDARLLKRRLISADGRATALILTVEDGLFTEEQRRPTLLGAQEMLRRHTGQAGLELHLTGIPVVQRTYAVMLQRDLVRSMSLVVVAALLLLALLFRTALGTVLPLLSVLLAVLCAVAVMGLRGVDFNIINAVVPTLLLVIGISDAIHLVSRYYDELALGRDREQAIRNAVAEVGLACLLTSVTAAIGFGSLVVAHVDVIKELGRTSAIGIGIAYLITLTVVPVALSFLRRPAADTAARLGRGLIGRYLDWNLRMVVEQPWRVLAVSLLITAVAVAGMLRMTSQSFLLEEVRKSHPLSVATSAHEDYLSGVLPVIIDLDSGRPDGALDPELLRAQQTAIRELEADPMNGSVLGLSDLVIELNEALRGESEIPSTAGGVERTLLFYESASDTSLLERLTDFSRQRAPILIQNRDQGSEVFFEWYEHWNGPVDGAEPGRLDELFEGRADAHITGANLVASRALVSIVGDLTNSLSLAFALIFGAMTLLFRSVRIGLVSVLPNILPLLLVGGLMGWAGIQLRTATVLIFTLGLGLAVNDTVHFLARYRTEALSHADPDEVLRRTLHSTGRAIIFTSAILIAGFATMLPSQFVAITQMGLLGATTIFGALLGDLFLLPVLLRWFPVGMAGR
jgi:predicted RND superfamily exporter protein